MNMKSNIETVRRNFVISKDLSEAINTLSDRNKMNKSDFVERALRYYIKNEGRDYKGLYEVINTMFQHIEDKIDNAVFSIDKNTTAINDVKKDSHVIVQCWNDTLLNNNDKDIILTKESTSNGIEKAMLAHENDVSKQRKKKLDNK